MIKECPVCKKEFDCLYPDMWAYKLGNTFFCSYKCIRAYQTYKGEGHMNKITLEQKKEVVELAIQGGDYIQRLKELGAKNPAGAWFQIKKRLETADPEKLEELNKALKRKSYKDRKAAKDEETVPEVKISGPIRIDAEAPEDVEVINKPDGSMRVLGHVESISDYIKKQLDQYEISAIRHKNYGEFYYDHDHNCVDWRTPEGDEVSMSVHGWKGLISELPRIMQMLGVEL